ncbi:heat-shock protein Hsp20 [Sulfolobus sp. A20]|uniref:archaeal heat shock protein Hsp14 n=2 Tax=Sulfolobaceae TaxID=118883 RepID=UPI000845E830|nr:archaeal heat shock protein Hsp14 [Sulfolobus sp. A20]TRM73959.1 Hsp20/alpha crystallin family protein [Sulfolobus sp. B5]TRM78730.1 Hsp20/alpha crystallin family protein [Sulfolobus sp. A20-N-F8]TRM82311.1 Hsp20/alpha crystallin family protein [Sulfolobus sp. A20-N-F6]TRM85509.1 Hsp20/alpha crystallin family protein [Sulfolobus sp. F3]TRM95529.1 Hsp20/alpha crystallin family protein [Sulfolobus sp. A20-N-G8]TRN01404.1 Hsp20/alpha crystallin family protein [Sulfolobus sp. E1]
MMDVIMREIGRKLNELSREFYESVAPPIDIYEEGGELVIIADLAGFSKDKINVRLTADNVLTISATRDIQYIGTKYVTQRPLKIYRRINLPAKVKKDAQVSAKYDNGVLTIRVPIEGAVSVKIE